MTGDGIGHTGSSFTQASKSSFQTIQFLSGSRCDTECKIFTGDAANLFGRRASHHGVARDGLEHQGPSCHHGTLAYGDVTEDGGCRTYEHIVADLWVPVAVALPSTCQTSRYRSVSGNYLL